MKTNHSFRKRNFPFFALQVIAFLFAGMLLNSCTSDDEEYFTSDYGVYIQYNEDGTVSVTNPVSDGGVTITTEGQHVYVQAKADDVTYFLSGTTSNGTFRIVSSEHSQNVVLNNVSITNLNGGAINILTGKKTNIVLPLNTVNSLTDGGTPEIDGSKAALFSEGELIFTGQGKLSVTGNCKHGIGSDDFLEIYDGDIEVKRAVSDGLHVHDYIAIYGGRLTVNSQSDGLDCDRGYIDIYDGILHIVSGNKGIATTSDTPEHDRHILIRNGSISIKSLDRYYDNEEIDKDSTGYALRSSGNMYIDGGTIRIDSKKKGISAGKSVSTSGEEDSESDVFQPQELHISGGEITCSGTVRPEVNLGTQNCLYYVQEENLTKGSTFLLMKSTSFTDQLQSFTSSYKVKKVFFSSSKIETGGSYKIVRSPNLLHQYNNISSTFTAYPPADQRPWVDAD